MPYPEYTNAEAVDIIESEGLEYAVRHYTSGMTMKDPSTSALWAAADAALGDLVEHLERETGRKVV